MLHYEDLHIFDIRMKHLSQTMENMDKHNRTRLDAIENTNYTMLKAICNFVNQD